MIPVSFVRVALSAVFISAPLFAQVDLSGNWGAMFLEDQPERIPGPELGDYLGLPITDANRLRARAMREPWRL